MGRQTTRPVYRHIARGIFARSHRCAVAPRPPSGFSGKNNSRVLGQYIKQVPGRAIVPVDPPPGATDAATGRDRARRESSRPDLPARTVAADSPVGTIRRRAATSPRASKVEMQSGAKRRAATAHVRLQLPRFSLRTFIDAPATQGVLIRQVGGLFTVDKNDFLHFFPMDASSWFRLLQS
jgi:hypothetical protein